jgi:glycosyltransferase involved in cell wall biosynthesis
MTKLSLCTIVKNEEKSLPSCLASVKDVVDEIIVLDTGSTDKTVEIAQQARAKVYHFPWGDDFAAARNEALKYVQGEWVLVLDADEVLTEEIVPQLKQVIQRENNLVINLIRQEIGAVQSPYSQVSRLFRRHPNTKARLMMEKFAATHPNDPYVCSKLGALYVQIGRLKDGMKWLKRGLKSNQAEPPVLFELYYSLGNAYVSQQDYERAKKQYEKAISQPILPLLKIGAYNNLGNLWQQIGDFPKARQAYQTVLQIDPNLAVGYYNLGMTLKALGKIK